MFEYKELEYLEDKVMDEVRRGLGKIMQWSFNGFTYKDVDLIGVLNILGKMGWELALKESSNIYILKREYK